MVTPGRRSAAETHPLVHSVPGSKRAGSGRMSSGVPRILSAPQESSTGSPFDAGAYTYGVPHGSRRSWLM